MLCFQMNSKLYQKIKSAAPQTTFLLHFRILIPLIFFHPFTFTSGLLNTEVVSHWLSLHLSMHLLRYSRINLALGLWGSPMNRRTRLSGNKLWHLLHSGLCPFMGWHGRAGLPFWGRWWLRLRGWSFSR